MQTISILGGNPLYGEIEIQGSKNAVLPILAATVLIEGKSVLHNCPNISDVDHMIKLLEVIGCKVKNNEGTITVDATSIQCVDLPEEYVTRMRSSVILMGALIGRSGQVSIGFPGGCTIGKRPIDMHISALEKLGAEFICKEDKLCVQGGKLYGERIVLPFPSVGATENIILAAVCGVGDTEIYNCAMEPEIQSLCHFLNKAGAKIKGIGTNKLCIQGTEKLVDTEFEIEADRIVAGTYLFATIATKGHVFLKMTPSDQLQSVIEIGKRMGADIEIKEGGIEVAQNNTVRPIAYLETKEYPGFPTDLQSPLVATLLQASGKSRVKEKIFPDRFDTIYELKKMGANIILNHAEVFINGPQNMWGESVLAKDLRGGAALVIAGLMAEGNTKISNVHYIKRGYEDICRDLRKLGANIDGN